MMNRIYAALIAAIALVAPAAAQQGASLQPHQVYANPLNTKSVGTGVTAISPILVDTSGLRCPTCLTGTGGALTATAPLSITGNNIALATPLVATFGGTNNAFTQFTGAASTIKTYTLPNQSGTIPLLGFANVFTTLQTVNLNAAAAPTPIPAGAALHIVAADNVTARSQLTTFGAVGVYGGIRYGGTNAARTATPSATDIVGTFAYVYDGVTDPPAGSNGSFKFTSAELATPTARGMTACISTTPIGSASTGASQTCQTPNGNLTVGVLSGTDPAGGSVIAASALGGYGAGIQTRGAPSAAFSLLTSSGATDAKLWDFLAVASTNNLSMRVVSDSGGSATPWLTVNRSGISVASVVVPSSPLALGTAGSVLGTLFLNGSTTGFATVVAQAIQGTPTLTLPTTTGTFAVSATGPLVLSAATGVMTCPGCATTTSGGAITGTAPINVSGAGAVSLSFGATLANVGGQLQTVAHTGDITTPANSFVTTLATVNGNVGTFGSATQAAVITVNGKGLTTAASNVTITPAVGSITGLGTGIATWLATPSSSNLQAAVTGSTGAGALVFANNALLNNPTINGSVSGTAVNSANSALTLVLRDAAGSFAAGTITATSFIGPLTGHASLDLALTGGTLTGPLAIANATSSSAINTLDVAQNWSGIGATNILANYTAYGDSARFAIRRANGTIASPTSVALNDTIGALAFRGFYTSGGPAFTGTVAGVTAVAMENFTSTAQGSRLGFFSTALGSASAVEGLTLQPSGGVSIGNPTTDPGAGALVTSGNLTVLNSTNTNGQTVISASKNWASVNGANLMAAASSYGDTNRFVFMRANGTIASPTQVNVNDVLLNMATRGWFTTGGPAFSGNTAALVATAVENYTSTAQGTRLGLFVTAPGTATSIEAMRLQASGGVSVGTAVDPGINGLSASGQVVFGPTAPTSGVTVGIKPYANSASASISSLNPALQITGPDGLNSAFVMDTYAAGAAIVLRRANTSAAAPSVLAAGNVIFNFQARGYNGTSLDGGLGAVMMMRSSETWSGTANGGDIAFQTTPNTTTTPLIMMSLQNSGGMTLGATQAAVNSAELAMAKNTASGTAPGAGFLKMQVQAGTNAGSCKIVAYAGTSNTPVTIIDNVGAGC